MSGKLVKDYLASALATVVVKEDCTIYKRFRRDLNEFQDLWLVHSYADYNLPNVFKRFIREMVLANVNGCYWGYRENYNSYSVNQEIKKGHEGSTD